VVAGLLLAGCTPSSSTEPATSASPAPSPSSSSSSSTSPSAAPEVSSEPTTIVVSTSELQLLLEDGSVSGEFVYADALDAVVAKLTELFGAEPTVTAYEGTAAADYVWDGFRVGTDGPTDTVGWPETYVTATATEINGIAIESAEGYRIGDDLLALEAADPDAAYRWDRQGVEQLVVQVQQVPFVGAGEGAGAGASGGASGGEGSFERAFHTELVATPVAGAATAPIVSISAPHKNFE
jgi:hypothetical protein